MPEEYRPKPLCHKGRTVLDRRKPFELFLKFGGGLFTVHFQCGRLVIVLESKAKKK